MADSQSSGISLLTSHALVLVFGLSSWLLVNAVWVELALIVETAPEGYAIASYMASESSQADSSHAHVTRQHCT